MRNSLSLAIAATMLTAVPVALTAFGGEAMAQDKPDPRNAMLMAVALGANVVDVIMGDLTGEGRDDALFVIDPTHGDRALRRHALEVVLMRRDAMGRLYRTATNARLLACGPCAAMESPLSVKPGTFTIRDAGTGTHATTMEYRFDYDVRTKTWRAAQVLRRTADPSTGRELRQELNAQDLGGVDFARFDPTRLRAFREQKNE